MQFENAESLTCTDTPFADVASHLLMLLLKAALLQLQAYAPMYNTLIDPPYEFAPSEKRVDIVEALELNEEVFCTRKDTPLTFVDPHMLLLFPPLKALKLQVYAPM